MEGAHHNPAEWAFWDGDTLNEGMWNSILEDLNDSCTANHSLHSPVPDAPTVPQTPTTGWDLNELGLPGFIPDLDLSDFGPAVMTDITSPVSSGGNTWSSSPLDFDLNSPTLEVDFMSQFAAGQPTSTYMGEDFDIEAPAIAPWDSVQQSPPQTTAGPGPLTMDDRPTGVPAREWRKRTKPEKCPICGKGHTYQGELKKHIVVHHPHLAAEHGVSTDRHFCVWCRESFARRDHLTRHLRTKHGRPKKRRNRG